ncbi:hypothetical protein BGZ51_005236 [Haplosporangium sp. Z 767]|nr:hypothetical protein BGZ51_005236 [Haplosporangium sp. Z 767]KAF9194926.1 hypothetical protein BGZ50_005559 [Haplosporangium sp. Z 11]
MTNGIACRVSAATFSAAAVCCVFDSHGQRCRRSPKSDHGFLNRSDSTTAFRLISNHVDIISLRLDSLTPRPDRRTSFTDESRMARAMVMFYL